MHTQTKLRSATNNRAAPEHITPCRDVIAAGQRRIEVVGPLIEQEAAKVHEGFWDKS